MIKLPSAAEPTPAAEADAAAIAPGAGRGHDVAIIGGGIVGLATAYRLTQQRPELRVIVLEK